MKEQEYAYKSERLRIPPKVYEGEILPPLPKPKAIIQDEAAQLQVIRMELNTYIRETPKPTPPQIILVEQPPKPETVWDEVGMAIGEGIADVRDFAAGIRQFCRSKTSGFARLR